MAFVIYPQDVPYLESLGYGKKLQIAIKQGKIVVLEESQ